MATERSNEIAAFVSDWPATVSETPVPLMRTKLPAGVVSIAAVSCVALSETPGRLTATVPVNVPATPAGEIVSVALAPESETMPPASDSEARSTLTVVALPARSIVTSPDSCWPSTSRTTPVPDSRRYDVAGEVGAGSESVCETPPTVKVSLTRAGVELSWTRSEPASVTPGIETLTVPARSAARPVGSTRTVPVPPVSAATCWPPAVTMKLALATPMRSLPPASCSIEASKLRTWPATAMVAPRTSMRRYGPPGRPSTAALVVLIATAAVAASVRPGMPVTATVPENVPAMPAEVTRRLPAPPERSTAPRSIETFASVRRVTSTPPSTACSKLRSALTPAPATLKAIPVALTRRYGPAGMDATVRPPPTANGPVAGCAVVLTSTSNVAPFGIETPGIETCTVPPKPPAMPAAEIRRSPLPSVSEKNGGPRAPLAPVAAPMSIFTSVAPMRRSPPERLKLKSPSIAWPKTSRRRFWAVTDVNGVVPVSTSAPLKTICTSSSVPGSGIVWSIALPNVLTRAVTSPVNEASA